MAQQLTDEEMYEKGVQILLQDGWTKEEIKRLQDYQVRTTAEIDLWDDTDIEQIKQGTHEIFSLLDDDDDEDEDKKVQINKTAEAKELCSGIFWIITENRTLGDYKLLMFDIPCDMDGNHRGTHKMLLNAKRGDTYNHKLVWENEIKGNSEHRPYNKKDYNYYPRGRVEIANKKATIFLNPNIHVDKIIDDIKLGFGLNQDNIPEIRVVVDGTTHYQCFIDKER
jgi:hypothetical protein